MEQRTITSLFLMVSLVKSETKIEPYVPHEGIFLHQKCNCLACEMELEHSGDMPYETIYLN